MKMDDVEVVSAPPDFVHHRQMRRQFGFEGMWIEPKCLISHRNKRCPRPRLRACEQDDIMAEVEQRVSQMRDNPLGTPIKAGGHRLMERGNLRNPHCMSPECGAVPRSHGMRPESSIPE
jgi:hypothetical protein